MTSNKKGSTSTAEDVARAFNKRLVKLLKSPPRSRRRRSSGRWAAEREAKGGKVYPRAAPEGEGQDFHARQIVVRERKAPRRATYLSLENR